MRTGVFGDIHGNHAGLQAVLDALDRHGVDRMVCLGDLVEGGDEDEGVIRAVQARAIPCVRGNHDEHNDLRLPDELQRWLDALPERLELADALFVHITPRTGVTTGPRAASRKIATPYEAWNVFDETTHRLIFVGHSHRSAIYGARSEQAVAATEHAFTFGVPLALDPDDRYIISVGAVGYPRDAHRSIRYGVWDDEAQTMTIHALDGPVLALGSARPIG